VSRNLSPSQPGSSSPQRRTATPLRGRRLAAATGVLLAVPLAAGCAAGFSSTTQQIKPNSGFGQVGGMKVDNVWVVVDPATGNAEIIGAVANTGTGADTLTRVTATNIPAKVAGTEADEASTGISVGGDSVAIPGGQSVSFGQTGSPELELAKATFEAGLLSQVTFTFAQAGSVTVTAQIQPNTGLFADDNPNSGIPKPKPTPVITTATATGTATPASTPTGTATATATATPTATKTK
jgi:hypothetical protein